MQHMDRLDRKILSVLQGNARASLQEIGAAVGLSPSPCWGRIKKMEEAGVIEGYTVRLNPLALARIFHRSRATNEDGIALVCPKIQVSNLDQRAGNAEAKLYRRN